MGRHHEFGIATGIPVHVCDPHPTWQRGSNENPDGLLGSTAVHAKRSAGTSQPSAWPSS